jgi:hypothetical protein
MDAAGAVDAQNAPTAPWKTAQTAVSHIAHTHQDLQGFNRGTRRTKNSLITPYTQSFGHSPTTESWRRTDSHPPVLPSSCPFNPCSSSSTSISTGRRSVRDPEVVPPGSSAAQDACQEERESEDDSQTGFTRVWKEGRTGGRWFRWHVNDFAATFGNTTTGSWSWRRTDSYPPVLPSSCPLTLALPESLRLRTLQRGPRAPSFEDHQVRRTSSSRPPILLSITLALPESLRLRTLQRGPRAPSFDDHQVRTTSSSRPPVHNPCSSRITSIAHSSDAA